MYYRLTGLILSFICLLDPAAYAAQNKWGYILNTSSFTESELEVYIKEYSIITITGFRISSSGNLDYRINSLMRRILIQGSKNNITVYPLITFSSVQAGRNVLKSAESSNRAVISISSMIEYHKFNGVHIDFEYLPIEDSIYFGKFLEKLKKRMGGKKLTAALFPQVDFPTRISGFHKLEVLAPHLDQVVIMAYDQHNSRTGPGPVTGLLWAEKNIYYFKKYFSRERIWLGIPAYGYIWINGKNGKAISARNASSILTGKEYKRISSGTVEINYRKKNSVIIINYSDSTTRRILEKLVVKHGLGGSAIWRLGLE